MANDVTVQKRSEPEAARVERTRSGRAYRPNVDILENQDELVILADMPGVHSEDIEVGFENGSLDIHGRVRPRQDNGMRYLLSEYGVGDFYRTFEVSEDIDASKISAEYSDGVLKLHLPKAEQAKPRKIAVKAG